LIRLAGLPWLSTAEAYLRQTVPAALSGRRAGEATMIAGFSTLRRPTSSWFSCESGVALAVDRVAGIDRAPILDSGVEAVELLEAAEHVLCEIELGLGVALEPVEIVSALPAGSVVATVSTIRGGRVFDRLLLALPLDIELLPASSPFAPELLGMVELTASIAIPGPRLEPHDAAELGRGDLLLLGPGPLVASLKVGEARPVAGHFDPNRNCFLTD
jgi:hypothetical protein